jgi:hypothetical protein
MNNIYEHFLSIEFYYLKVIFHRVIQCSKSSGHLDYLDSSTCHIYQALWARSKMAHRNNAILLASRHHTHQHFLDRWYDLI